MAEYIEEEEVEECDDLEEYYRECQAAADEEFDQDMAVRGGGGGSSPHQGAIASGGRMNLAFRPQRDERADRRKKTMLQSPAADEPTVVIRPPKVELHTVAALRLSLELSSLPEAVRLQYDDLERNTTEKRLAPPPPPIPTSHHHSPLIADKLELSPSHTSDGRELSIGLGIICGLLQQESSLFRNTTYGWTLNVEDSKRMNLTTTETVLLTRSCAAMNKIKQLAHYVHHPPSAPAKIEVGPRTSESAVNAACKEILHLIFSELYLLKSDIEERLLQRTVVRDRMASRAPGQVAVQVTSSAIDLKKALEEKNLLLKLVVLVDTTWTPLVEEVTKIYTQYYSRGGMCDTFFDLAAEFQSVQSASLYAQYLMLFAISLWPYAKLVLETIHGKRSTPHHLPAVFRQPLRSRKQSRGGDRKGKIRASIADIVRALYETSTSDATVYSEGSSGFGCGTSKELSNDIHRLLSEWERRGFSPVEIFTSTAASPPIVGNHAQVLPSEDVPGADPAQFLTPMLLRLGHGEQGDSEWHDGSFRLSGGLGLRLAFQADPIQGGPYLSPYGGNERVVSLFAADFRIPFESWVELSLLAPLMELLEEKQLGDLRILRGLPSSPRESSVPGTPTVTDDGKESMGGATTVVSYAPTTTLTSKVRRRKNTVIIEDPRTGLIMDGNTKELAFSDLLSLIEDVVLMKNWSALVEHLVVPLCRSDRWYSTAVRPIDRADFFNSAFRSALRSVPNSEFLQWEIGTPGGNPEQPSGAGSRPGGHSTARQMLETLGTIQLKFNLPSRLEVFSRETVDTYSEMFSFLLTLAYAHQLLQRRWHEIRADERVGRNTSGSAVGAGKGRGGKEAPLSKWEQHAASEERERQRSECVVNHLILFVLDSVIQFYKHEAHSLFARFRQIVQTESSVRTVSDLLLEHERLMFDLQHLSMSSRATESMWRQLCIILALAIDPHAKEDRRQRPTYAIQRVKVAVGGLVESLSQALTNSTDEAQLEVARKTQPLLQLLTFNRFFSTLGGRG